MSLNHNVGDSQYRLHYDFNVRFICNYLSRKIRGYHFLTKEPFDTICINVGGKNSSEIVFNNVLQISVPFNMKYYENTDGSNKCKYYIELFQQGFVLANTYTDIPLNILNNILCKFEKENCENVWIAKRKDLKELGIKIILKCVFSMRNFSAYIIFLDSKIQKEICSGMIVRTKPDEIYFDRLFKDMIVRNDFLYIRNYNNIEFIKIDIDKVLHGFFQSSFMECPYDDDDSIKDYNYIIQELSYNG